MSMDYNEWSLNKDIISKIPTRRDVFDKMYWDLLPQEIQLDRMVRLTNELLDNNDDEWANNIMRDRRGRRRFINPRTKTKSMWS